MYGSTILPDPTNAKSNRTNEPIVCSNDISNVSLCNILDVLI